jgi:hypothetical protein
LQKRRANYNVREKEIVSHGMEMKVVMTLLKAANEMLYKIQIAFRD